MVYGVVAWGAWSAVNSKDLLELPPVTPRLVLALLVLGFPLALGLTWALQVTPEGIEKERSFAPGGVPSHLPQLAGLAVLVLAVGGPALLFLPGGDPEPTVGGADGG